MSPESVPAAAVRRYVQPGKPVVGQRSFRCHCADPAADRTQYGKPPELQPVLQHLTDVPGRPDWSAAGYQAADVAANNPGPPGQIPDSDPEPAPVGRR